jgi:hypothetical protein
MPDEAFATELARRDAELEAARANADSDTEEWYRVQREYDDWRKGIRLLGGRPTGGSVTHPVIHDFLAVNPEAPRVGPVVHIEEAPSEG